MQNGSYPWPASMPPPGQKSWNPGYQASLTDLFLKKNSLNFGMGIPQFTAANRYIERSMDSPPQPLSHNHPHQVEEDEEEEETQKCAHPESKDESYPCEICQQYATMRGNMKLESATNLVKPFTSCGNSCSPHDCKPTTSGPMSDMMHSQMKPFPSMPPKTPQMPLRQFVCIICHRLFTQKGNLKTHMMIHTGEKPYGCTICGKSFTQKGNVDTHMKIHTGEKEFCCDLCTKRFTQKGNLKTHIRSVHTKEKPFGCNLCNKSFSQKGNMKTHMRTHNKDDRLPCTICGKTFSQKGNLKTHMQRHTGEIPSKKLYNPQNHPSSHYPTFSANSPGMPSPLKSPLHPHSAASLSSSLNSPALALTNNVSSRLPPMNIPTSASSPSSDVHGKMQPSHMDIGFPDPSLTNDRHMSSPVSLVVSTNPAHNHSHGVNNTTPSPCHSQMSSPSPKENVNYSHMIQDKPVDHSRSSSNDNYSEIKSHQSQMHSSPSHDSSEPSLTSPTPPASISHHPPSTTSIEFRPFYSAPATPLTSSLVAAPHWFPLGPNRNHTNHSHSSLDTYSSLPYTTPLSRLTLLASHFASHSLNNQQIGEKKHQEHQINEDHSEPPTSSAASNQAHFQSPTNPDFSQLLD